MRELVEEAKAPKLRTIDKFAEDEIIIPSGEFQGRRFRLFRHPILKLWFNELESGRWRRHFILGPNQDGKTFAGSAIPIIYKLFEKKESVIFAAPDLNMVSDKWRVDILPVIQRSRFADLLPRDGAGSKSGDSSLYQFGNGAFLRFMTARGDKSGFTSKNVVVTEADKFGFVGGSSVEDTDFGQLERRQLSYPDDRCLIAECTATTQTGLTWHEYQLGTQSRIALKCPQCGQWVTPEREHLVGWQEADTKLAAISKARVTCPACTEPWTNEQRIAANHDARLVHRGQSVDHDGAVVGPVPQTDTLGFRWTAINSILNPSRLANVGGEEWAAQRAVDEDEADTGVRQRQWALPSKPKKIDVSGLDSFVIMRRTRPTPRGVCPDATQCCTLGIDVGKWACHWTLIAWMPGATPHVADYGVLRPLSNEMAEEKAITIALRQFRDESVIKGWKCRDTALVPTFALVDMGNWQDHVLAFCMESGAPFFASKGYGIGQRNEGDPSRTTGSKVAGSGDGFNMIQLPDGRGYVEIKVNHWKAWFHARIKTPVDQPGGMSLFNLPGNGHLEFAKQLTAEHQEQQFTPKDGDVMKFVAARRANHWFDASVMACVAGYWAGMRLFPAALPPQPPVGPPPAPRDPRNEPSDWLGDLRDRWRSQ